MNDKGQTQGQWQELAVTLVSVRRVPSRPCYARHALTLNELTMTMFVICPAFSSSYDVDDHAFYSFSYSRVALFKKGLLTTTIVGVYIILGWDQKYMSAMHIHTTLLDWKVELNTMKRNFCILNYWLGWSITYNFVLINF